MLLTVMRLAPMEAAIFMMLGLFLIMGAMGLYEAWRKKRGVLGWIVSFVTSVAGGAAIMVSSVAVGDLLIPRHPSVGEGLLMVTPILMLFGSWLALRIVNRFR